MFASKNPYFQLTIYGIGATIAGPGYIFLDLSCGEGVFEFRHRKLITDFKIPKVVIERIGVEWIMKYLEVRHAEAYIVRFAIVL